MLSSVSAQTKSTSSLTGGQEGFVPLSQILHLELWNLDSRTEVPVMCACNINVSVLRLCLKLLWVGQTLLIRDKNTRGLTQRYCKCKQMAGLLISTGGRQTSSQHSQSSPEPPASTAAACSTGEGVAWVTHHQHTAHACSVLTWPTHTQ